MKRLIQLLVIQIFFVFSIMGQDAPKFSNEFLAIGIGAKALSMANANVAAGNNGVYAAYWNPAILQENNKIYDIGFMHAEQFAGQLQYDFAAIAYKLSDSAAVALSIIRLGADDIPNTLDIRDSDGNFDLNKISYFTTADYALLLSYSKKTKIEGLSIGGNAKLVYRHNGDFADAYGFGLDAGILFLHNKWRFAAMARDVSTTFNAWIYHREEFEQAYQLTGNEVPENTLEITLPSITLAVARDFRLSERFGLLAEFDASMFFDGKRNTPVKSNFVSIEPKTGIELSYNKFVFVRAGIGNIQKTPGFDKVETTFQPNLGLGFSFYNFTLDYALTNFGEVTNSLYSNIFSLRYSFGKLQ